PDVSRIANIAEKGLSLSDAKKALKDAGFTEEDYEVKSDTGKMVLMASNWIIQSVTDGDKPIINVRKESDIKAEEAKKKAEEESKKKEEEAARQAAEEEAAKKAADEEQARKQAEAAAAEAQRQAEEQARQQALQQQQAQQNVYYANCDAARAAGAAPLYQSQPGYSTKLDRDRDGIACE
ncbi:excalibur calcium-binding domain-containing protein, partial [Bifidobacterium sp. UTCIF-24]